MQRIGFLFILSCAVWACNSPQADSTTTELLEQPPFLEWTGRIENDPENDSLYFIRGRLLMQGGHTAAARTDFEKAWSIKPAALLAEYLANTHESPQAQCSFLKQATNQFPGDFPLEYMLAESFQSMDSTDAALYITQKWLQSGIEIPEFILLHASLLEKKGNKTESLYLLETLYENEPNYRPVKEILALRYASSGDSKALPLCEELKRTDSTGRDPLPSYYQGIYYSTTKAYAAAIQSFDRTILIDYNFIEAYIEKTSLLYDQKNFKGGLEVLSKALAVAPDHASVYYWTAKCQQALGDKESARFNYLKAYGLDKSFIEAKAAADQLK
jgi:tetratricopeptide (TPR) repeat protein